ncbi:MAG: MCE family protein [SAR324 cluster bacterium]|uniref:MCE family protein n=1 Tax=SAR324 cluster bacterium TaxID=2024889 RepID=A0A7X9FVC4_9DELT|nr:MCE family protein [SAR324 cluster bacterium]
MQHSAELKAGGFVLTALFLFTLFIWVLGNERQIFSKQQEFYALFKDVKGLSEGAPVRLGGISIGRVSKISFSTDYRNPNINVTLLINEDYLERIRSDSLVSIETQGLLGDRFVNISMASGGRPLPPGSMLSSTEPADISQVFQKAQQIVDNTVKISENVNKFFGEGGESAMANISNGAKSLSNILKEIESGNGILHGIIYKDDPEGKFANGITKITNDLSAMTKEIREGDGIIHALIFDKEGKSSVREFRNAVKNVADLSAKVAEIALEIKDGKGLAHELIFGQSPQSIADLFSKLNETVDNVKKASDALSNGTGSLGALLIDPQLYENLVEITDGAKRSFLLRQAIRASLGK